MCSNPESAVNPVEPWWRSSGYDAGAAVEVGDSVSKKRNEEAKTQGEFVTKEVTQPVLDETYGPEHQHLQHVVSTAPPAGGEYLVPHNPPELVGHSIACTPYPYSDPYYGGLMAAYGAQALVNPHLLGVHQARMPLPLEMAEEPVYVNPKQYNGIMRRRQSRAKAELEKKLIKVRKPYLHESRHQHAMRRQRGCGGRFLNTKKLNDEAKPTNEGMEAATTIMQSVSSSAVTTQCTGKSDSSNGQEEIGKGFTKFNTSEQHTYSNNEDGDRRSCYQHQDFRMSAFHPLSGERGEEGDCSGHVRGNILARQTSHLALTIQ